MASVAVLYTFKGSCFASVPQLALIEKGYSPEEYKTVEVDLLNGANFNPSYLRINPKGTVPTLVVPQLESVTNPDKDTKYTAITDTTKILEFLDRQRISDGTGSGTGPEGAVTDNTNSSNTNPARSLAPGSLAAKARDDDIIALTQAKGADPNFLLLCARTEAELKAKNDGVPGMFIRGRKKALQGFLKDIQGDNPEINAAQKTRLEKLYNEKLAEADTLLKAFENPSAATEFLTKGQEHYLSVSGALIQMNAILPREDRSGFVTLADLHAGAWFARILSCVGATELKDIEGGFKKLLQAFGRTEDELLALKNWWTTMVIRKSFQEVYGDGLH